MSTFLDQLWKIIVFIGVQYTLGRRGSYPYGLLVQFSLIKITIIVLISDMIQTAVLLHLLEFSYEKIRWLKKLKERLAKKEKKETKKSFWLKFKKYKGLGIIAVAALPYGGGALTGSILAVSMKMEKKRAFTFITIGCTIGAIIFYLGFAGIISIFK